MAGAGRVGGIFRFHPTGAKLNSKFPAFLPSAQNRQRTLHARASLTHLHPGPGSPPAPAPAETPGGLQTPTPPGGGRPRSSAPAPLGNRLPGRRRGAAGRGQQSPAWPPAAPALRPGPCARPAAPVGPGRGGRGRWAARRVRDGQRWVRFRRFPGLASPF